MTRPIEIEPGRVATCLSAFCLSSLFSCTNLPSSWKRATTPTHQELLCARPHESSNSAPPPRREGGLKREEVQAVVRSGYDAFRECYTELMARLGAPVQGSVSVRFYIDPSGQVGAACIGETELNDQRLSACVVETFKQLHFDASSSITTVAYPILFEPYPEQYAPYNPPNAQPAFERHIP
jgi:hypothetical protein